MYSHKNKSQAVKLQDLSGELTHDRLGVKRFENFYASKFIVCPVDMWPRPVRTRIHRGPYLPILTESML